jgi:DNA-binding transcriptional LysR family regulator
MIEKSDKLDRMIGDLDLSWQRIEPRHLVALHAISVTGSFRQGAIRLGYSQSTLSEQIATLERLVGQPLIERPGGRRRVVINAAGLRLLEHADEIGTRYLAARADLEAVRLSRPVLRLGVFQSVAVRLYPGMLRRLNSTSPELSIELTERVDDGVLLDMVRDGSIDACFAVLPLGSGPFEAVTLLDDPYFLLVAADGPLAESRRVEIDVLKDQHLIDYREIRAVNHAQQRLATSVRVRVRTDDAMTIHALVGAGVGVAVLPKLCIDFRDPAVAALEVHPQIEPRTIALVTHSERSVRGANDLIEAAHAEAAKLTRENVRVASGRP